MKNIEEMITYQKLSLRDIQKLHEIDRTETIDGIYYLQDGRLILKKEVHQVPDWSLKEKHKRIKYLERVFDQGATFFGAFHGNNFVGMSVLDHQPVKSGNRRLNLEGLWVSHEFRGKGIGTKLFQLAAQEAKHRGARALYVSATPSKNTVSFYIRLGCKSATPIDKELYKKEPEDIHLELIITDK